jgi:hypothetical protein
MSNGTKLNADLFFFLLLYAIKEIPLSSVWREEHIWNFRVLQRVHISNLLYIMDLLRSAKTQRTAVLKKYERTVENKRWRDETEVKESTR